MLLFGRYGNAEEQPEHHAMIKPKRESLIIEKLSFFYLYLSFWEISSDKPWGLGQSPIRFHFFNNL